MVNNPFVPQYLVGRQTELAKVSQILKDDGDLLIAGVAGSGRQTLVRWAAHQVGARVLTIDCLRTTDGERFLQLLAESLMTVFTAPKELATIQTWIKDLPLILEKAANKKFRLVWHRFPAAGILPQTELWEIFQALLSLPQKIAEGLDCRVVIVLQNFTHIRSWDRKGTWEAYLRQEIQQQSRVSYALIATVTEPWMQDLSLHTVVLAPLSDRELSTWLEPTMAAEGLLFDANTPALELFASYVQGNFGDAIALIRRIWLDCQAQLHTKASKTEFLIQPHHVHRSMLALIEDLSSTFESLIMLLPPSQVRVLESLALDPTVSPHRREYIQKHQLSKGGSLQGALESLEQKGLVYGAEYGYQIALPMLLFWLKQRLA
ncbi:ATP-binding protein [Tumidithrix helvetica PCC 7403]|uniref:ATP-binding protein n=1 Tax=Tumidithrix helvetica TaxID=3457545 RepID=UPI003C9F162C